MMHFKMEYGSVGQAAQYDDGLVILAFLFKVCGPGGNLNSFSAQVSGSSTSSTVCLTIHASLW